MKETFETFKPENSLIAQYVEYYYLDIKPNNTLTEFECFPHFNNTISLYTSHFRSEKGEIIFKNNAFPLQIFTPIRENILKVKQLGPVHRVVIVFKPLGIYQFYTDHHFSSLIKDYAFFLQNELEAIFTATTVEQLTYFLDKFLESRYSPFYHEWLQKSVITILENNETFSVEKLSDDLKISRQHINRIFRQYFGISVKKFHEIVLFRKTINRKLFIHPDESFTKLAYEFNYNDQSHFNKVYRNFTENSPTSFFSNGTVLGEEDTFWHLQK